MPTRMWRGFIGQRGKQSILFARSPQVPRRIPSPCARSNGTAHAHGTSHFACDSLGEHTARLLLAGYDKKQLWLYHRSPFFIEICALLFSDSPLVGKTIRVGKYDNPPQHANSDRLWWFVSRTTGERRISFVKDLQAHRVCRMTYPVRGRLGVVRPTVSCYNSGMGKQKYQQNKTRATRLHDGERTWSTQHGQ